MAITWSNGSLTASASGLAQTYIATKGLIQEGKFYWEVTIDKANLAFLGVLLSSTSTTTGNTQTSTSQRSYSSSGYIRNGSVGTNFNYGPKFTNGDVISVLLDMDLGTLSYWVNGTDYGVAFDDLLGKGGVYPHFTNAASSGGVSTVTANFGATSFKYKIPTHFKSLDETQSGSKNILAVYHEGKIKHYHIPKPNGYFSIIPAMKSATSPSGKVEASSTYGSSYEGWRVFDKVTNLHANGSWHTGAKAPQWVSYEGLEPRCVTKVAITGRLDSLISSQSVKKFSVEGYNELTGSWEVLFQKEGEVSWKAGELREFEFANDKSFKKHRLYIHETTGTSAFAVTEIDFLEAVFDDTEEGWKTESLSDIAKIPIPPNMLSRRSREVSLPMIREDNIFSLKINLKEAVDVTTIKIDSK